MRSLVIVSILICLALVKSADPVCSVYRCSNDTLTEQTCIYSKLYTGSNVLADNQIKLDPKPELYCPFNTAGNNSTSTQRPVVKVVHGEKCVNGTTCYSGNCTDSKCVGFGENAACQISAECTTGLWCGLDGTALKCLKQVEAGKDCTNDYQCPNGYGCNKVCTEYYSLLATNETTSNLLCASGYTLSGKCVESKMVDGQTEQCKSDQTECKYVNVNTNDTFALPCRCSLNDAYNRYCPYSTDNANWKKGVSAMKSVAQGNKAKHTALRFASTQSERKDALAVEFPKFREADKCVVDYFTSVQSNAVSYMSLLFMLIAFMI